MIAPGALVGNIHALLAGAGGAHQRAVHVDDGPFKKSLGLFCPHLQADIVESILQGVDIGGAAEAPTKVAGGGWVGDAAGADRIKESLIVAAQFDIFQTGAFAECVVGDVADMIRFVVGQMVFEQDEPPVNRLGETESVREGVDGANAAVGNTAVSLADFVMDVAGGENRPPTAFEVELVEPAFNSALASVQLSASLNFHSKSLSCCGG